LKFGIYITRIIDILVTVVRARPSGMNVDMSDGDQEVWSLLDPMSVVCCELQPVVEARSDIGDARGGRSTTTSGDLRWQEGLLASVNRATQQLQLLASSTVASTAVSAAAPNSRLPSRSVYCCSYNYNSTGVRLPIKRH